MIDPPHVTESPEKPAVVTHLTIPRNEIQRVMGPAVGELMAAIHAQAP